MKLVILAGGLGRRLSVDENRLPKPLTDIGGKPILWHIMKYFSCFGITEFVLCLGYKGSEIKESIGNLLLETKEEWKVDFPDTGIKSTRLKRIQMVSSFLGEGTHLLAYADNLTDLDAAGLIASHRESGKPLTMTGVYLRSPYGHIFKDGDNISYLEKPEMRDSMINGGFMAFETSFLKYIEGDEGELERDIIPRLADEGLLNVYEHRGNWNEISTMKDYEQVQTMYESGKAYWEIWKK